MKNLLIAILFLTISVCGNVYAIKVSSLYQVELPIASQSESEKANAISTGLTQVLVKVSGNPKLKILVEKPESYVQEVNYVSTPEMVKPYVIQIRYNPVMVDELLKKSNTLHWGENRPLLLVWLALSNAQQSTVIIGNQTGGSLLATMKQQGERYGLPLVFPAMDIGDTSQVLPEDVWQMQLTTLKEAGKRYSAEAFLIGKIQQESDGCQSQWRLVLSDAQWEWSFKDKTAEGIVIQVLDRVSQTLARHYLASSDATDSQISLIISNVTKPEDLARLFDYLKHMPMVKQIQLMQMSGGVLALSMQLHGSVESFEKNVAASQHLVLKSQTGENRLLYEWAS